MLAHDEYPEPKHDKMISATTLLKPIKQIILGKRVPKSDASSKDIAGNMASAFGTAVHNHLEAAWKSDSLPDTLMALGYPRGLANNVQVNPEDRDVDPDMIQVYTEFRTSKWLNGWEVSGEFDFLADGRLRDLKTTGTYTYTNGTNDDKYPLQGSIYRWLNPEKVTDDVMAIDFVFTDWSALAARTQQNYPQMRMLEKLYNLKSVDETEKFIAEKLSQLDKLLDAPEADIPQCTNDELWVEPSKWKYYKNPNKTARATRVYDNPADAQAHKSKDGHVGIVIEHKGTVKACKYCDAFPICQQAQRYLNSGELKL